MPKRTGMEGETGRQRGRNAMESESPSERLCVFQPEFVEDLRLKQIQIRPDEFTAHHIR